MVCIHCGRESTSPAATHCPWCSEAVAPPVVPAAFLAILREYRTTPPTVARLFRKSLKMHVALSLLFGCSAGLLTLLGMSTAAVAFGGAWLGAMSRDLGMFRRVVQIWPHEAAVLDWELIDRLAAGEPVPTSRDARGTAPAN